ncbi:MAG: hypothetical protein K6C94_00895 [Candidatus Gastranaerophilales bacterium]|nr:hypothetical protein [Candidatus Gastranaerophilales bacterium]
MAVVISSSKSEKTFGSNKIITVGSSELNDFFLPGQKFELTLEYNPADNTYIVTNYTSSVPYFKGQPFKKMVVNNVTRFLFPDSEEFINIKVLPKEEKPQVRVNPAPRPQRVKQPDAANSLKTKLDEAKDEIDERRIAIVKEISHKVRDLKKKIAQNLKGVVFAHFALFGACYVCAFAVTNYISGLSIQESANYIHLPSDLKLWLLYTILIMGIMLLFKQGMFGYFYSQSAGNQPKMSPLVQFMLIFSSLFMMAGVYIINLIYYLDYTKSFTFPFLISIFFVGFAICMGMSSAYYKSNGSELAELLNKYEYREDFEMVIKDYQKWVEHYVNTLSKAKMEYVSESKFKLRLKSVFEIIIGMLTAPFLAFGVSNTLALCFPEVAGWIRISGVRFSPVFLVLASFLIIFAFFLFVHGFYTMRKISNSDVIKHDGFSNYLVHCADIFGLEGTTRAAKEMKFAFYAATVIILIEFTMNISYFSAEIGQDMSGLLLSIIAAAVPTALLIAETFLCGGTKFSIYALESISAKVDK